MEKHPNLAARLSLNASLLGNSKFELAILNIPKNQEDGMSMREKTAVNTLLLDLSSSLIDDDSSSIIGHTANCLRVGKEKF